MQLHRDEMFACELNQKTANMITGQLEEVNNATLEMTNRHKRENTDLRKNLDEMKDKLDDKASMIEKLEGKLFKFCVFCITYKVF